MKRNICSNLQDQQLKKPVMSVNSDASLFYYDIFLYFMFQNVPLVTKEGQENIFYDHESLNSRSVKESETPEELFF